MKTFRFWTFLAVMAVIFHNLSTARGATVITATITVTNIAQVGTNWTVNGNTRTWTNNTAASPQSFIQTTNSIAATASNLYQHITRFPYLSPFLTVQRTSPTNIVLRGSTLTVTTNNYFHVSYSTNVGTNLSVVQVPFENVVGDTNRTNNAHWLVDALNRFPYTNALATNANVITNTLIKGAHPYQEVLGPIGFRGRTAVNSNFFATNGFTSALTNINPVLSNAVNYGKSFRSEGAGNSQQFGSNAIASGTRALAIGNDSFAGGADSMAIGTFALTTNGMAIGSSASAWSSLGMAVGFATSARGLQSLAVGYSATAFGDSGMALGSGSTARDNGQTVGLNAESRSNNASAFGLAAFAGAVNAMAMGTLANAAHSNSLALGPLDDGATAVTTTDTNQIRIGTSRHKISAPGLYESPRGTNSQFAGTNIARGSWSYPRFDLSTIANGNNISIPLGTNRFVRLSGTVTGIPTLCGFIGGATSGGLDGQEVVLHNDLGFGAILAQNTVDPVPANRIETADGADVTMAANGWAVLQYSGADSRWHVSAVYPLAATTTNTAPFGFITTNLLTGQAYTNLSQRGHVVATISMTNVLAGDVSSMALIVDQDADGSWDTTNGPVRINGVALSAGEEQLFGLLQPGARFAFTNQSAGVSPSAVIRPGSCQWSRW